MSTKFTLVEHNKFVLEHGEPVAWRKGVKCPCGITDDPQRVRPSCKVCQGVGFRYAAPVTTYALITGMQQQKALLQIGLALPGDLLAGFSPYEALPIADWDTFRLTARPEGTAYDGDVRVRDPDGAEDYLAYDARTVHACFSIDPASQIVQEYLEGTDFTVSGRVLTWLPKGGGGVRGPAPRQKYSIKYHAEFDWIAFVTPMQRYDGGVAIGPRAILRKRHLAATPTGVPF